MKYKVYRFSFDILKDLLSPGIHRQSHYEVLENGLPVDAEIMNVQHAWPCGAIDVIVRSEQFPEVAEGDLLPATTITIRSLEPVG